MKVKPYRKCDLCGCEYNKVSRVAKLKVYQDPYPGEFIGNWRSLDICPSCYTRIIEKVKEELFK